MIDRDGEHSGHRPGKGDRARRRGPDRSPHRDRQIDSPVPPVVALWGEPGHHRPRYRSGEQAREQQGGEKGHPGRGATGKLSE